MATTCSVMDQEYRVVFERRLPNDLNVVLETLSPYRERLKGVAVESTYNWYWLVDGLKADQYPARLANPARMQENIGLKSANDKTDARFLTKQMVMGVLATGRLHLPEGGKVRAGSVAAAYATGAGTQGRVAASGGVGGAAFEARGGKYR